jgi:hypothetical protein
MGWGAAQGADAAVARYATFLAPLAEQLDQEGNDRHCYRECALSAPQIYGVHCVKSVCAYSVF